MPLDFLWSFFFLGIISMLSPLPAHFWHVVHKGRYCPGMSLLLDLIVKEFLISREFLLRGLIGPMSNPQPEASGAVLSVSHTPVSTQHSSWYPRPWLFTQIGLPISRAPKYHIEICFYVCLDTCWRFCEGVSRRPSHAAVHRMRALHVGGSKWRQDVSWKMVQVQIIIIICSTNVK